MNSVLTRRFAWALSFDYRDKWWLLNSFCEVTHRWSACVILPHPFLGTNLTYKLRLSLASNIIYQEACICYVMCVIHLILRIKVTYTCHDLSCLTSCLYELRAWSEKPAPGHSLQLWWPDFPWMSDFNHQEFRDIFIPLNIHLFEAKDVRLCLVKLCLCLSE